MKINLITQQLFLNILEVNYQSIKFDLHSDYSLEKIFLKDTKLIIKLVHDKDNTLLEIVFDGVIIIDLNVSFNLEFSSLHTLQRGKYESPDGHLFETYEGKKCFYIEFGEENILSLLCSEAFITNA